ncbi:MAG: signal peptidase I [Collinsella sp.]|nr:signal peptidase I [Collinsella sp.]
MGRHTKRLLEWIVPISIAIIASLFLRAFVISPFVVPTGSMLHTIEIGDHLLAQKVTANLGLGVERGDIVVFKNPEGGSDHDILVKRVIATEGQTITLRAGSVLVDGTPIDEPYATGSTFELAQHAPGMEVDYPYIVPEGCVWVMGDNRENSADSRHFGAVPESSIIGVAVLRYWPLDRLGPL